ncbi:L-allo-threonine aldolase [Polystyrenella longa]|uniref:L-allo-threonine aldolase n=1 Tax=Polystyrenella longa TaxID=2528007 RepID=A0A518CKH4_9PLAN|nr:GntG family PLP-dependent aldolase [Polystyrenella longa]QDU79728.1 L-allo-threonine aldolase [Polystyrenella longa]
MASYAVDLRSDTKSLPTSAMKQAMIEAELGDDMTGEDPTVNKLEAHVAQMFGKEAAVIACSGTQSNQMGVWAHTQRGDEIILEEKAHIGSWEAGAPAILSGVSTRFIAGDQGRIDVEDLAGMLRADDQHLTPSRLLCIENTTNAGGGISYSQEHLNRLGQWAHEQGLKVHMDGARFFNAVVSQGYSPADACQHIDTISLCFSKGLGCPIGSILVGSQSDIQKARRARKIFGGALRQAGMFAAAAQYALDHQIDRLQEDHDHARIFAEEVATVPGITVDVDQVETNLVFFDIDPKLGYASQLGARLSELGIGVGAMGSHRLRACFYIGISADDAREAARQVAVAMKEDLTNLPVAANGPYSRG